MSEPPSNRHEDALRVLTMNLWGRRGSWQERRSILVDGIRELRPDLVAFQEAIVTDEHDQVRELVNDEYHIVHQSDREPDGQGASIATRWPPADIREVDLHVTPRTAGFACTTVVTEIRSPDPFGPLLFANHVPNWQLDFEYERERQAIQAARSLEDLIGERSLHVVLAGDFTADPDSASVRFISGRQSLDGTSVCYRDAWESAHPGDPGHTFVPENPLLADWDWPFRRLDYIFVRCGEHGGPTLAVSDCARVFDEPVDGVWASDHFGVVADLTIPYR
jgi:endonuclease/exonuclease/phosphatase family metal-dependent hydrolase